MFWRGCAVLAATFVLLSCGSGGYSLGHATLPGQVKRTFDQAAVDQNAQRLYVADETAKAIDLFDVSKGDARFLSAVRTPAAPKGLAVAGDLHVVFAGLSDGSLAAIDSDPHSKRFGQLLAHFPSGDPAADLIDYDAQHHRLYVADPAGKLVILDALQHRRLGAVSLSKGLEQPRWDSASGRVYVSDADRNSIYSVDPGAQHVVAEWKLPVACGPTGMGLDGKAGQALVGCGSGGQVVVWDVRKGRSLTVIHGIASVDQVVFDAAAGRYFAAGVVGGSHHGVGIFGGSPLKLQNSVTTHADTAGVAFDERTQTVYQPDAHPGEEGVVWFALPAPITTGGVDWVTPLTYVAILVVVFGAILLIGRRRARARAKAGRPFFS